MIHNMTGGGAGLKLSVVGGTSRPGGSDTLYWDGNTEGLESVDLGGGVLCYYISPQQPSLDSYSLTLSFGGESITFTEEDYPSNELAPGITLAMESIFVIEDEGVGEDIGGLVFSKAGIYAVAEYENGIFLDFLSLTIPGYTGFGGGETVKDNTIWVNTDTAINGYAFSADQPDSVTEGVVWIKIAAESTTPLNIDKKNAVILYPQTAQQYVSGAWVGKTAQVYTDGAWHELWDGYYYKLGEYYEGITGGYASTVSDNTGGTNNGLLTFNSNNMVLSPRNTSTQGGNLAYSVKAIDVSNVNTLVFDCHADGTDGCGVGVATQKGVWGGAVASKSVNNTARANVSVDVSNVTGEVYIRLSAWWNPTTHKGKLTVYNIYKQ